MRTILTLSLAALNLSAFAAPNAGAVLPFPPTPTASETFDVGADLGSPVSPDYAERAPFKFNGKIQQVKVDLN